MSSPSQNKALEAMIRQGPLTMILVFSPTCPHCVSYMPFWSDLEKTQGRKTNMVAVKSDVYSELPLSEKKEVNMVPTVLYVDKEGRVSEASEPRNTAVMTEAVKAAKTDTEVKSALTPSVSEPIVSNIRPSDSVGTTEPRKPTTESRSNFRPVIPGSTEVPNPLPALPGLPVTSQSGGSPWAAFLGAAATQAGPAALLLGAYGALPRRSSGLGAARRRQTKRRVRS